MIRNEVVVDLINKRIDDVNDKINQIDSKVDELLKFKWQIIGGSVFFSSAVAIVFQIMLASANK